MHPTEVEVLYPSSTPSQQRSALTRGGRLVAAAICPHPRVEARRSSDLFRGRVRLHCAVRRCHDHSITEIALVTAMDTVRRATALLHSRRQCRQYPRASVRPPPNERVTSGFRWIGQSAWPCATSGTTMTTFQIFRSEFLRQRLQQVGMKC